VKQVKQARDGFYFHLNALSLKNKPRRMIFFVWLLYVRFCTYQGSKRIVGGLAGLFYGMFFGIFGIMMILSSRRLDDEHANAALMEKYRPLG
jgi:hypothetical protein